MRRLRPLPLTMPAVTEYSNPNGEPDGEHPLAHLEVRGAADGHRLQVLGLHFQKRQVRPGIGTHHGGVQFAGGR